MYPKYYDKHIFRLLTVYLSDNHLLICDFPIRPYYRIHLLRIPYIPCDSKHAYLDEFIFNMNSSQPIIVSIVYI